MSDIESEAKPFLLPLMLGEQRTLDPRAQTVIAGWAFLRALGFNSTNKTLPRGAYQPFYDQHQPPDSAQVWGGTCVEPRFNFYDTRGLSVGARAAAILALRFEPRGTSQGQGASRRHSSTWSLKPLSSCWPNAWAGMRAAAASAAGATTSPAAAIFTARAARLTTGPNTPI